MPQLQSSELRIAIIGIVVTSKKSKTALAAE